MEEKSVEEKNKKEKALFENLVAMIWEQQLKLGYRREKVRLYYPLESLEGFLGKASVQEMEEGLHGFFEEEKRLGEVEVTRRGRRFCLCLPEEASYYVKEHAPKEDFLVAFLEKMKSHPSQLEEVLPLFEKYGKAVIEREPSEDLLCAVHFEGGVPDSFVYCFSSEEGHLSYHRLMPWDYEALYGS